MDINESLYDIETNIIIMCLLLSIFITVFITVEDILTEISYFPFTILSFINN